MAFRGAERAGIKKGDIITKLDDKKVLTIEELSDTIKKHKVGDVVQVEIYDQLDKYRTISVKLRESSD